MLDRAHIDSAVQELVDGLADSRFCLDGRPDRFEASVLDVAQAYNIGVTNVMGRVAQQVAVSSRFNPTRKARVIQSLRDRGVGAAQPALRCY